MNDKDGCKVLAIIKSAAEEAGIYPYWSIAFGTVLGRCREYLESRASKNFIEHDTDMDVLIQSWNITKEQEDKYVECLERRGMYNDRAKFQRRTDNHRLLWTSIRRKPNEPKCCNWFMFNYGGFTWHSKGREWVNQGKFDITKYKYSNDYDALAKGVSEKFFKDLIEVDFAGGKYNIPLFAGTLLDNWYLGWKIPKKGGASARKHVLLIPRWENEKQWRII